MRNPIVGAKLQPAELEHFLQARAALQARNPDARITNSDTLRLAVRTLSVDHPAVAGYAHHVSAKRVLNPLE